MAEKGKGRRWTRGVVFVVKSSSGVVYRTCLEISTGKELCRSESKEDTRQVTSEVTVGQDEEKGFERGCQIRSSKQ